MKDHSFVSDLSSKPSTTILGFGATSTVLAVEEDEKKIVKSFKSNCSENRECELRANRIFENHPNLKGVHVVNIVEAKHCWLIQEPRGQLLTAFPCAFFAQWQFIPILNVLEVLHRNEMVHRDVGIGNIIAHGNAHGTMGTNWKLCLIDFGFAVHTDSLQEYSGATYFASDRILNLYSESWERRMDVNEEDDEEMLHGIPHDDLSSLVRTIAYATSPLVKHTLDGLMEKSGRISDEGGTRKRATPNEIFRTWKSVEHMYPILGFWENVSEDSMYKSLRTYLVNQVHRCSCASSSRASSLYLKPRAPKEI